MEIEKIYQLLAKNEWEELLDYEYKNRKNIIANPMLKSIFDKYFINSLLDNLKNRNDKTYSYLILKKVYNRFLHHYKITYNISKNIFEKLVIYYLEILQYQEEIMIANRVANDWDYLEECRIFIKFQSKDIENFKNDTIRVSKNSNIINENYSIPLFKSKQEYEFFYAIREYYPNYFIYPNVALSCIIDYTKIRDNLNNKEIDYFFKAIIDNVVFSQSENNFKPSFY